MISQTTSMTQARFSDYLELAKLRLVSLVMLSAAVGFFLAVKGPMDFPLFLISMIGTAFVAAGSMSLNQWMERREDAMMTRTANRPLPAGRMETRQAAWAGILFSFIGLGTLYFFVNSIAGFIAALTTLSYLLLYTPLKSRTSLCTVIGAVPGALPPLIGWASAAGMPTYQAWVLFAIIFLWQMPHFLAIAWFCRKDYAAAGFKMLSVTDPSGEQVATQIVLYASALLPVSLLPSVLGMTGIFYFFGALLTGVGFILQGLISMKDLDAKAKGLFRLSILHLAFLLVLMVLDKA